MNPNMRKVLDIASDALLSNSMCQDESLFDIFGKVGHEVLAMLREKNGFFAFEAALHVFPTGMNSTQMTLERWNEPGLWKMEYGHLCESPFLCFAEDIYGNQFVVKDNAISIMYAETAEFEPLAAGLDAWADEIMADWKGLTGYELAHQWQSENRPLQLGERLVPKKPFVIGGTYEVTNLYAENSVDVMRFRGDIAQQIEKLPNGKVVNVTIRE